MATDELTALITGGTSGIGQAAALKFTRLGIHVLVVGRNRERGDKTVAEIRTAGGTADFMASDLRDASSAREVAKKAVELGGGYLNRVGFMAHAFLFPSKIPLSRETQRPPRDEFYRRRSRNTGRQVGGEAWATDLKAH